MDNPAQTTYNKGCANTGLGGRPGRDDTKNHPEIWKGDCAMTAEILSVGTELLLGDIINTNAA